MAGNADPYSGYQVVVDGKPQPIGGTSAVAPLWAGLIARLAQASGTRFGLLQPLLYAGITPGVDVAGFHDIVEGNNGAYKAGPGWDACTGLGSPNGTALLSRLSPSTNPTPPPTPPVPPTRPVPPAGPARPAPARRLRRRRRWPLELGARAERTARAWCGLVRRERFGCAFGLVAGGRVGEWAGGGATVRSR